MRFSQVVKYTCTLYLSIGFFATSDISIHDGARLPSSSVTRLGRDSLTQDVPPLPTRKRYRRELYSVLPFDDSLEQDVRDANDAAALQTTQTTLVPRDHLPKVEPPSDMKPRPKPFNDNGNKLPAVPPFWRKYIARVERWWNKLRGKSTPGETDPTPGDTPKEHQVPKGRLPKLGRPRDHYPDSLDPLKNLDVDSGVNTRGFTGRPTDWADSLKLIYRPLKWVQDFEAVLPPEELEGYLSIERKARAIRSDLEEDAEGFRRAADEMAEGETVLIRKIRRKAYDLELEAAKRRRVRLDRANLEVENISKTATETEHKAEMKAIDDRFMQGEMEDIPIRKESNLFSKAANSLEKEIRDNNPTVGDLLDHADSLLKDRLKAISDKREELLEEHWKDEPELWDTWKSQWDGGSFWDKGTPWARLVRGRARLIHGSHDGSGIDPTDTRAHPAKTSTTPTLAPSSDNLPQTTLTSAGHGYDAQDESSTTTGSQPSEKNDTGSHLTLYTTSVTTAIPTPRPQQTITDVITVDEAVPMATISSSDSVRTDTSMSPLSETKHNHEGSGLCGPLDNLHYEDDNRNNVCQIAAQRYQDGVSYTKRTSSTFEHFGHGWGGDWNINSMGCTVTFVCKNHKAYENGVTGSQIKDGVRQLYAHKDVESCGSIYFNNGCHITAKACSNCKDVNGGDLAPKIKDSPGTEGRGPGQ